MESFIVFHAPTGNTDLPAGIYRLRQIQDEFPSAQLLARAKYVSDAIQICKWLNDRPTRAWAEVLDTWGSTSFELTRVGRKLECEALRPTDVKIVMGCSAFGGDTIYHRIILSDADLAACDQLFRDLSKFSPPSSAISYWQSGHGKTILRLLDDE